MEVQDKFVFHSSNGKDYVLTIVDVNNRRPSGSEYMADVFCNGIRAENYVFFGDDFLDRYKELIEKI